MSSRFCWTTRKGLAAGLIDRSGGNSRQALQGVEDALGKMPKVSGGGSGQVYLAPATARLFDNAEKIAEKAGDSFVTVERLLLARRAGEGQRRRENPGEGRRHAARAERRHRKPAQGPHRRLAVGRERL